MSINKVNKETGEVTTIGGATIYSDAPIGTVIPFCGDAIPDGFLLADGQPLSRTEYSELFNVIGTTYGTGDGSTTFNLPSMKGMFDFTNKQVGHGSDAILNFETTYQSGSGTQNFTVQKSGYYWVNCILKQAEKKDYNFLQIQKSGISSRLYFRSFGAAGKYEIDEFIWFEKGDYVAKHEATDSGVGVDGYGKLWIVPTTGVTTNYIIKAKMVGNISDATQAAISEAVGYSTSEQLTGGKWIDGKPIYRRVFKADSQVTITNSWKNVSGITDAFNSIRSNIEMISEARFFADASSATSLNRLEFREDSGQLQIMVSGAVSITFQQLGIVLEYTKTT